MSATGFQIAPRKERITQIAAELIAGQVSNGSLNPDDEVALDAACLVAVKDAAAIYDAAIEFIS